ncbi:hypothetical protein acsn021_17310 [Anaerocolumna cellulosilytica]|uniref:Uncharacterized protein n=1 Tax=Anaerocolumna cellulosilytica TaxID=433286 RepID=A0A6S6R3U5_9FIRM|nr:hypothetical protein [Anaerocolumna cellulosilytica]MBB5194875.1 hypothetical protein [Anaerocolumna cellulosilytica]BCJ94162.1 hypothetical protein acsn021_17310 [Anaerocolumna cellulosilytica]
MIQIEPLSNEGEDCYKDILASVTCKYSSQYLLMYSQAWFFDFDINKKEPRLGEALIYDWGNIELLMEQLTGIKAREELISHAEEAYKRIHEKLEEGLVVSFVINMKQCYWHSWSKLKDKGRNIHIITAYGKEENSIICMDCQPPMKNIVISKQLFVEGYEGKLVTFEKLCDKVENINYFELMRKQINRQNQSKWFYNSFCAMHEFADCLKDIKLENECVDENEDDFFFSPIFHNLNTLAIGRKQFGRCVSYIDEESEILGLNHCVNQLFECSNNILLVRSWLIKARISGRTNVLIEKASDLLHKTANIEKKIASEITMCLGDRGI